MPLTDKTIICRDCGRQFVFTVGEQEFFTQKGFTNDPSRCPECRAVRKTTRHEGYFNNGRGRPQREMYPAVCARCGRDTEVPFQPRDGRPVYCTECYRAVRQKEGQW